MMQFIKQELSVSFTYGIFFTEGLFRQENATLANILDLPGVDHPRKILAVIDAGVHAHHTDLTRQLQHYASVYSQTLELASDPLIVPGGEPAKNDPRLTLEIQEAIHNVGLCRHSYVLAIGGGAVLDVAGYAAATAHRGIRLIRVPTTVLSQNDSGVGVKNGINAFGKKNFLGTFAPPYAVINDKSFLETLDDRDWISGVAEAVKVALIKDPDFFESIEKQAYALSMRDVGAMEYLIRRCAELHIEHIATSGDPFEMGTSRPLDFGHWAGHKLEQLTAYTLRHGEAVAIGIAIDCLYSVQAGLFGEQECERVLRVLETLGFTLYVPEMDAHLSQPKHPDCLLQGLEEFREHLGGELTIMLLKAIGQGVEVHDVNPAWYQGAIATLRQRHNRQIEISRFCYCA